MAEHSKLASQDGLNGTKPLLVVPNADKKAEQKKDQSDFLSLSPWAMCTKVRSTCYSI